MKLPSRCIQAIHSEVPEPYCRDEASLVAAEVGYQYGLLPENSGAMARMIIRLQNFLAAIQAVNHQRQIIKSRIEGLSVFDIACGSSHDPLDQLKIKENIEEIKMQIPTLAHLANTINPELFEQLVIKQLKQFLPFLGEKSHERVNEPWLVRALHHLGAEVCGIDLLPADNLQRHHFIQADLSDPHTLTQLPDNCADVINTQLFIGNEIIHKDAPEMAILRIQNPAVYQKMYRQLIEQFRRLLKESTKIGPGKLILNDTIYEKRGGNFVLVRDMDPHNKSRI